MSYKKQAKILFFSLMLLFVIGVSFFVFQKDKYASAELFVTSSKDGSNFSGFAWSENYGWIKFNDEITGAVLSKYGVNVNYRNGILSGFAWSPNVGWISFAGTSYDKNTGELSGTAHVVALGTEGDLELKTLDGTPSFVVKTNAGNENSANYGKFSGLAWNDNVVTNTGIGWLQFRGNDTGFGDEYGVFADLNKTPIINPSSDSLRRTNPNELVRDGSGGGSGIISAGDTANFSANWTDNDDSDNARLFICKNNAGINTSNGTSNANNASLAQKGINNWHCNGGTWCAGSATTNAGLFCSTTMNESVGVGTNKTYYTYICDEFAYCTNPLESGQFIINDRPGVANPGASSVANIDNGTLEVITAPPLSAPDPEGNQNDDKINFTAAWDDDVTNGSMMMYVCGTNSFNYNRNNLGCNAREWCHKSVVVGGAGSGNITNCAGQTNNTDTSGITDYYVYMCDGYKACTTNVDALTGGHGQFFINLRPKVAKGANGMSAPNWDASQAATNAYDESDLRAILKWSIDDTADGVNATALSDANLKIEGVAGTGSGDLEEKRYQAPGNQFGPPSGNPCDNTGCLLEIRDHSTPPRPLLNMLRWGTSYKWTTWTKDEYAWSEPLEYNHDGVNAFLTDDVMGDHPTDRGVGLNNNENLNSSFAGNKNLTFTTYKHNFPIANADADDLILPIGSPFGIKYFPEVPSAGEEVRAYPNSYRYANNEPTSNTDAITGDEADKCLAANCKYFLEIDTDPITGVGELKDPAVGNDWVASLSDANNPFYVRFFHDGDSANQTYVFTVVDDDGYFDTDNPASIDYVNESLPSWQEVR